MPPAVTPSLNDHELTALLQISIKGRTDPEHRRLFQRLLHLGLVDETPAGMRVTQEGAAVCQKAAVKQGWGRPGSSTAGSKGKARER